MKNAHHGISLDDFLKEEGLFEEAQALAFNEVVVWQLTDAMQCDATALADKSSLGCVVEHQSITGEPPA